MGMAVIQSALTLAAVPCTAMILLSALVFVVEVPKTLVRCFQHLAAGIVLSAVAVELVPIISEAPNDMPNIMGIVFGFSSGVALFLLIAKICPESDEDDDDDDDPKAVSLMDKTKRSGSSRVVLAEKAKAKIAPPFPMAFTVAVLVDSTVDGMLIGLSSSAGASAGIVMAIALAVEMGFLALTFATVMRKQPFCIAMITLLAAPAFLALGCAGGATAAAAVASNPAAHTALIAFGIAALLYLVTEELLLEAHEGAAEEHTWYIDFFFFFGFMASFLLEKFSDAD